MRNTTSQLGEVAYADDKTNAMKNVPPLLHLLQQVFAQVGRGECEFPVASGLDHAAHYQSFQIQFRSNS